MRLSIHHKITLTIFLLIAILLTSIYIFLSETLKEHTFNRIQKMLYKETALSTSYINQALADRAAVEKCDELADLIGNDLKLRCTIIREDGIVLGDSELSLKEVHDIENHADRPEVREAQRAGIGSKTRHSTTLKEDLLYVAQRLSTPALNGYVRLAVPLSDIRVIQSQVNTALFVAFCAAFLIAFIISFSSSLLISKPIKYIAMMAKRITTGNYSGNIIVHTGDEIEDLANSFNEMSEQISRRIKELNANSARLEAILLSLFDGIMVVNKKGLILFINAKLKELFHIEVDPVGKQPIEVIRKAEVQEIADAILMKDSGVVSREVEFQSPDTKTLLIHATSVVRDGAKEGAVLVFHDITALKNLEKVRKDFVANVSHELRTPLTSIKGYAETLLEGALQDQNSAHEFVDIIYKEANRLNLLVNDLLDLSRFESDKHTFIMKSVHIENIVKKAIERVTTQAREKQIAITTSIPEGLPSVSVDEAAILQVMLNILDNAIKYSDQKGSINVEVTNQQGVLQVAVRDNGIGIAEADLPRIFERFYRADKNRSRTLGGTGLGLAIVKHIILAHNGTISVESTVGKGSVFRFTLPIS
ncbi:MAG: HAMP domain-containing protein [Candidatus Omnitrophica bacterium]|nr:HAMP domain-containing protein [Candidatus Omnitrophota bacterium]